MFVIKTKKPVVALLRQDNGQQTTDNGGYAGTTDSRNYGNWLRFATPDNGQQTTDNRQRTTEGKAGSLLIAHSLSLLSLPSVPLYTFYPLSTFAFSP